LQWWADARWVDKSNPTAEQAKLSQTVGFTAFQSGKSAATVLGSWFIYPQTETSKLAWGLFAAPRGTTGERRTQQTTDAMIIYQGSKAKDQAWEVMKFGTGEEWESAAMQPKGGMLQPSRVALQPKWAGIVLEHVKTVNPAITKEDVDIFANAYKYASPQPIFSDHAKAMEILGPAWDQVFKTGTAQAKDVIPVGVGKSIARSRGPFVHVVQSAEDRSGPNASGGSAHRGPRGLQRQRSVRARVVVVALELAEERAQVRLVENDHVVQALAPEGSDQPFGDRVRARRPDRRQERLDAEASRPRHESPAVDGIPVPHEVPGCPSPRRRLDQLAPDPRGGRAGGHVQVDELAPGVADEDEHVQRPERQGLDGQQVHAPDVRPVVAEEGPPTLARRAGWSPAAVALDGGLADGDPEFQELTADPLGAPPRVVARHRRDQVSDLGADARPAHRGARAPAPEQPPAPAVPPDDRLRPDHEQVPAPVPSNEASQQPEELVPGAQAGTTTSRTGEDRELVAQHDVLRDQVAAVADGRVDQGNEEEQVLDHRWA
jgi:hypothetical protein